jgi:crotonobetainyl-CoA:carnitine CoA-transferase CaiB-like acyl-CoA transferase
MRDEHYISRGLIQQTDHGPVVGSPFHLSDTPVRPPADGPLAGEHTRARLGLLGLGTSEIDELYANGVVA